MFGSTSRKSVVESLRSILPDIPSPAFHETLHGLQTCALFDRSAWKRVRFGDVVESLNETERDPEEAGIDRFIGLEHLEPGSLHIREWGSVADGTTFTRRCRPGQVLFGKRRAYQRKVAVAEFDAVVSGDIYVLAPKNDCLLPELLPFLCMSERFFRFAVETSAGSLSPRTNWSHLAKFEFALPPIDQQRRIAEILWAVDKIVQVSSALLAVCCESEMGVFEAQVCGNHEGMWPLVPLEDIVSKFIDYRGKSPEKTDTGVPLLTAKNVRDGFLVEDPREFIASDEYDSWMRRGIPKKNDLLFTTEAPLGNVARVPTQRFALAQRIICLSPDSTKVHPSFFFWGTRSSSVQGRIRQNATGTTVFGIKQANLRKVLFPLPTLSVQPRLPNCVTRWLELDPRSRDTRHA